MGEMVRDFEYSDIDTQTYIAISIAPASYTQEFRHVGTTDIQLLHCRLVAPASYTQESRHVGTTDIKLLHCCLVAPASYTQAGFNPTDI